MSGADRTDGCVFCEAIAGDGDESLIVFRGATCFVILNLYPYNNGHVMVVPRRHLDSLSAASAVERAELMDLARLAELALGEAYHPHGLNLGINLGRSGGAGIVDHVHLHVVPRWEGDTNFMTVVGDARVIPESLERTADTLRPIFARLAAEVDAKS